MVRKIKARMKSRTAKVKPGKAKKAKRKLTKSAKKSGPKAAKARKKKPSAGPKPLPGTTSPTGWDSSFPRFTTQNDNTPR